MYIRMGIISNTIFLSKHSFLSSYLCDEAKIVFLFAYDQFDVRYKSEKTNYIKSLLSPQLRWGKLVMVKSMPFIAAPVMFLERSILA